MRWSRNPPPNLPVECRSGLADTIPLPTYATAPLRCRPGQAAKRAGQVVLASYLVGIFSPLAFLSTYTAQRFLLAMTLLDIPLLCGIHFGWREDQAALGAITGLDISVTTFAVIGLYVGLLVRRMTSRGQDFPSRFRLNLPLTLYLCFAGLSCFVARDVTLSLIDFFVLFQTYLFYLYVSAWIQTREELLFVLKFLLIGLVLESMIMVGMGLTGHVFHLPGIKSRLDLASEFPEVAATGLLGRVGGTVGSPNGAASYLVLLLIPAVSVLLSGLSRSYRRLALLGIGLGLVSLVFTLTRGAWVTFLFGTATLCFVTWRRGWLSARIPFCLSVALALLLIIFHSSVSTRILGDDRGSAEARVTMIKSALNVIRDNPAIGVGLNNYVFTLDRYAKSQDWAYAVHNTYLLVWSETGIGGLIAFLWFLTSSLHRGWLCWKSDDRLLSSLALGFTVGLLAHMAHMLVELLYHGRGELQLGWLVVALLVAMHKMLPQPSAERGLDSESELREMGLSHS